MQVITEGKIPVKMWIDEIEQGALNQAIDLSNLPFAFKHIAIMPDSHQGYGMPIGAVMATKGVIVPNAVGVDIGCGMRAIKTDIKEIETDDLKKIMSEIREKIPVGSKHNKDPFESSLFMSAPDTKIIQQELESSKKQLGTLGGGNHFIEIQKDQDGFVWIMIHSGSRNIGLKVATYYHKQAIKLCEKYCSDIPNKDLSFLPMDTKEATNYFMSMNWCLNFAKLNRRIMMRHCKDALCQSVDYNEEIDVHHNYAVYENHFKSNVMVHRKGATSAKKDQIGIIPGSQGTKSYIVKGKGNPESFNSCSHGAGRIMGRKQAIRELDYDKEVEKLSGIVHSIRTKDDLDEASGAYKDIGIVMEEQRELVEIVTELNPLGVIKG